MDRATGRAARTHCFDARTHWPSPLLCASRSAYGLDPKVVKPSFITQKVIQGVYDGVTSSALDDLAAETAAYLTTQHPDYARLAARISVSNLHKMTDKSFSGTMDALHGYVNPRNGQKAPLISPECHEIIQTNAERLNAAIMCARCPPRSPPPSERASARAPRPQSPARHSPRWPLLPLASPSPLASFTGGIACWPPEGHRKGARFSVDAWTGMMTIKALAP